MAWQQQEQLAAARLPYQYVTTSCLFYVGSWSSDTTTAADAAFYFVIRRIDYLMIFIIDDDRLLIFYRKRQWKPPSTREQGGKNPTTGLRARNRGRQHMEMNRPEQMRHRAKC
jgi:hypothetical protein